MAETNHVSHEFEEVFKSRPLAKMIEFCEKDELAPKFVELFRRDGPVLEAGCGSGRWLHYLQSRGFQMVGIDWSSTLKSKSDIWGSSVQFDIGDMRQLPYADSTFAGILAHGSIEHVIEGPERILRELARVLRADSQAVITVPYMSPVRKVAILFQDALSALKRTNLVRRLFGKPVLKNSSQGKELLRQSYNPKIRMDLLTRGDSIIFFQYQYTKKQFKELLQNANFKIEEIGGTDLLGGLYHNFGFFAGKWSYENGEVELNFLGRLLKRLLSKDLCGHMVYAIVSKNEDFRQDGFGPCRSTSH